ncbi:MAG TPA: NAD(P)-dependent alcohol dehydrogenase [Acidobacteriota bacterium]|nr:NAD(P)-dependent alcohol dehydrogenase [Acidobacteriota bacterium]
MRASVLTEFGPPDVLQLREVAKPVPKDRDILIRVHATSVNFGDTLARNFAAITPARFHMPWLFWLFGRLAFGFGRPRVDILGSEFAGEVEDVGRRVTRFKKGDPVFGYRGPRMGAYAEYLCMPETGVVTAKPANMTFEQAASSPYGAIMALGLLRKIRLQPGQDVLVVGASGGIGSAVVQLARHYCGARVTGVCGSARLEYVKSLGADRGIDYTREDFLDRPETYDIVIDVLGKTSYSRCRRILKPRGRLVFVSFKSKQFLQMLRTSVTGGRRVVCALIAERQKDLVSAREMMEASKIRSIVDRVFPLEQAADAHRYAESGAKTGGVVISLL